MSQSVIVSNSDVKKIAGLANLHLNDEEFGKFAVQFTDTLKIVDELQEIDTTDIKATYQVGEQTSVFRNDEIDTQRMLTQEQALSNAKRTHQGYFVVDRIIEEK